MNEIGDLVRTARHRAGLLQRELADKVGITNVHLSYIENGHNTPTLKTLKNLAKACGFNVRFTLEKR